MDTMEQRRNAIEGFVNEKGNITFAQLEKRFPDVSQMTLRTDLKSLDEAKKIVRIHGGRNLLNWFLGQMIISGGVPSGMWRRRRRLQRKQFL